MALEKSFRELMVQLQQVADALQEALITIGDQPPAGEGAVADSIENTLLDVRGSLQNALEHGRKAEEAGRLRQDFYEASQELGRSNEAFLIASRHYFDDLTSHQKLVELEKLGRDRGPGWGQWVKVLKQSLEQSRTPLEEASVAFVGCWRELAEILAISLKLGPK